MLLFLLGRGGLQKAHQAALNFKTDTLQKENILEADFIVGRSLFVYCQAGLGD